MRHQMQREHAQIMKITNVFFNPISAFAQTNLICLSFQQEIRDGPFNFQGGGYAFFSNILIPNVTEKNILILVEGKKYLFQSFCHIT